MKHRPVYIYEIRNTATDERYIGATLNFNSRKAHHRTKLYRNTHQPALQASWNIHGQWKFEFAVLETTTFDKAKAREQFYIDKYRTRESGYGFNTANASGRRRPEYSTPAHGAA